MRNRGRQGAEEELPEGVRRLEVPAVVETEVIVEVAEIATSTQIREMTMTWKT